MRDFHHPAHPADEPDPLGTTPGETCNRVQPPDEDALRKIEGGEG